MVATQVSEYCGSGHPDKMADYIADYLLDCVQTLDPDSRAAFEVLCTAGAVYVGGEYTCRIPLSGHYVKGKVKDAIYNLTRHSVYFIGERNIYVGIKPQSAEIVKTCLRGRLLCGDHGCAFGYATRETPTMLPMSHHVALCINRHLYGLAYDTSFLTFDYKIMVTCRSGGIESISCAIGHDSGTSVERVREFVLERGLTPALMEARVRTLENVKVHVNRGGSFTVNGLNADTGVTNRKLMADAYGSNVLHGGGGLSGKDLTKPDRLLAYYARYIAKNAVASGECSVCRVRLLFSYGAEYLDGIEVDCDTSNPCFVDALREVFNLPYCEIYALFRHFRHFSPLARFGHFGAEDLPWEMADRVARIRRAVEARIRGSAIPLISDDS